MRFLASWSSENATGFGYFSDDNFSVKELSSIRQVFALVLLF